MQFILRVLAIFIAVAVACWLVPGMGVVTSGDEWVALVLISLIIALLNMTIKPILQIIGLPITIISLGIFYLVINTLLLYLASWLGSALFGMGLYIASFGSGFIAAIVIYLVSSIMNGILGVND